MPLIIIVYLLFIKQKKIGSGTLTVKMQDLGLLKKRLGVIFFLFLVSAGALVLWDPILISFLTIWG